MLISFTFENLKSYGEKMCLQPQAGSQGTGYRSGYARCSSVPADGLYESRRCDCHSDRTTSRDIEPLQRMQATVKANASKVKVIYVLNGWNRWRASNDFLEWSNGQAGNGEIVKLPQSESFVQASAYGQSVVKDARFGKAVEATRELCNLVHKSCRISQEKPR